MQYPATPPPPGKDYQEISMPPHFSFTLDLDVLYISINTNKVLRKMRRADGVQLEINTKLKNMQD